MIEEKYIDQIFDRADIVDVVGEFVSLKKKGIHYKACCPFHSEKTPSFVVTPGRGTWHCFGSCNRGGNVVSFLMEHESMTYPEALRWLAKKYHIEIEEVQLTPQQQQARMKRESMWIANEKAAEFFLACINEPEGKNAMSYAVSRWGEE